jgi:tetratricopeptide (TPR) repeat protein
MDQALYCFQKASVNDPNDTVVWWWQAIIHIEQGDDLEAISKLNQVLKIDNCHKLAIKEISRLYLKYGNVQAGIDCFEKLLEADIQYPLENWIEEIGEDEEIVGKVSMGVEVAHNQRMGYEELNMLSELFIEGMQYQRGLQVLKEGILRLHGQSAEIQQEIKELELINGKYQLPTAIISKLAIFHIYLDNLDVALAILEKFYQSDIQLHYDLYFDVGEAYMAVNEYTESIKIFEMLVEEDENANVWGRLGECYEAINDITRAIEMYENVLSSMPNEKQYQDKVITLLEQMGEEERARQRMVECKISLPQFECNP